MPGRVDQLHRATLPELWERRATVAGELCDLYHDLGFMRATEVMNKSAAYINSLETSTTGKEREAQFMCRLDTKAIRETEGKIAALEEEENLLKDLVDHRIIYNPETVNG